MKALRLLLAGSVCALSFLTAKADKQFIDLAQYDAVNSTNVTVTNNGDGSVTLSLTDPEQAGVVLFNGATNFTGWEKVYFTVAHSDVPNGAFTYIMADNTGTALFDNSTEGGKYLPYSSQTATTALDLVKIAANGGNISNCYFAVKIAATALTTTLSNAYAYAAPTLPADATDLQTIPYVTHSVSGSDYTITSAPKSISVPSITDWSSGNKDIIGDFNQWNRIPGKYWDLTSYNTLKIQVTAPAEMAGKTFRIRLGNIPVVVGEDPANYGENYTANSKYVDITLTGGTQVIPVDLSIAADMTKYLSIIRFQDPTDGPIALDIDFIVVSSEKTVISPININKNAVGNVYNLQGILVKKNASLTEAQATLPNGLYILNGKKIFVNK
jgi:hypothetical protein